MPKIYEYLGVLFYFYSNEHEPIHVHGTHGKYESKAEFVITDGKIIEIRIKAVKEKKTLKGKQLLHFREFIDTYAEKIVEKWVDYFIYHKNIKFERITKRIN